MVHEETKKHTEPVEPPNVRMHYATEFCMSLSVMFHLAIPSMYIAIQKYCLWIADERMYHEPDDNEKNTPSAALSVSSWNVL